MSERELPAPATPSDLYLAAIHDVLGEILHRLPTQAPAQERDDGTVELQEPATPRSGGPKSSGETGKPGPRPVRKSTARKPGQRTNGTSK